MAIEIKVPSPGESITQVQIAKWLVANGEAVEKDQEIVEIDSDKASFPIASPEEGIVKIMAQEGDTVAVGAVIASVEPGAGQTQSSKLKATAQKSKRRNQGLHPNHSPLTTHHLPSRLPHWPGKLSGKKTSAPPSWQPPSPVNASPGKISRRS